jgi:hypothetical protein
VEIVSGVHQFHFAINNGGAFNMHPARPLPFNASDKSTPALLLSYFIEESQDFDACLYQAMERHQPLCFSHFTTGMGVHVCK